MPETDASLNFPLAGIDQSDSFCRQKPKQMPNGEWAKTAASGQNVRSFDADGRMRGGSRPGLVKAAAGVVVADWIIQELAVITSTDEDTQA